MNNVILIILGMAAVTYLPRLAPFVFFSELRVSPFIGAFLKSIPVAAIGALIVPGVFTAIPECPWAALAGFAFTLVYCMFRNGIIVPVLGAVGVTYLFLSWC